MSLYESTIASGDSGTTDALFRAWVSSVRAALEGCGLVRTSDTGQINTASVTTPSVSTYAGYDIYRFDDAEQSNDPVFFKVEYGHGASSQARPALRITTGSGSDGAGTITGADGTTTALVGGSQSGTGTSNYIGASFFDGCLCLLLDVGTSTERFFLVIERLRDRDTGDFNGQMIIIGDTGNGATVGSARVSTIGSTGAAAYVGLVLPSSISNSKMVLGGWQPLDGALSTIRSAALVLAAAISVGDFGTVETADGSSVSYKRPATQANTTKSVGPAAGSTQTLAYLLRTA